MTFYARMQATAEKLISSKGQDVTLRKASGTAYNPATGTVGVSYTDNVVKAVVTAFKSAEVDGVKVQRGDKRVLMTDEPAIDDLIVGMQQDLKATSIIISHDIQSTLRIANRIAMLHDGKIVESGTPKEFLNSKNPIVQRFLEPALERIAVNGESVL